MANPQQAEQVSEPISMRDELVNALNNAAKPEKEKDNAEEQSDEVPEEIAETEDREGEETIEGDNNKEQEDEEGVLEEGDDDDAEEVAEKELPLIPNNWSKEEKESFQALLDSDDPDKRMAAEIMLERYNSFKKTFFEKTQQYAKDTKDYKEISKVFEPVQQMMQANGVDKASYIKNMMAWEHNLARDPVNTVKAIMQKFGVKPSQLGVKKTDDFDFDDDDLTEQQESVNDKYVSKQELQELRTAIANQPLLAQIAQFANATDSSGKLMHPRFNEVQTIMGQIMKADSKLTMAQAYRKAVKVFDDESPTEDEPAVDLDKIKQRVNRARKASKGVKTGSGKPDLARMSIKEELMARLNQT